MKSNDAPILVGTKGEHDGQRWLIDRPLMLGRDAGCDIVIRDRQISRFHVRLQPGKRGVEIEDLGSKNGTYLKEEALKGKMVLMDGDVFVLAGIAEFQFVTSEATMPLGDAHPALMKLMVDFGSRQVWVNNRQLVPPLSAQQFLLLHYLCSLEGKVASRSELIEAVWGSEQSDGVSEQALDALIRRLRDRLKTADPSMDYVVTVRGPGVKVENVRIQPIF